MKTLHLNSPHAVSTLVEAFAAVSIMVAGCGPTSRQNTGIENGGHDIRNSKDVDVGSTKELPEPVEEERLGNVSLFEGDFTSTKLSSYSSGFDEVRVLGIMNGDSGNSDSQVDESVVDFSQIPRFGNLRHLILESVKVFSLEPLVGMRRLKFIDFRDCHVQNLESLRELESLEVVKFSSKSRGDFDLERLSTLKQIRRLQIIGYKPVNLASLTKLGQLYSVTLDPRQIDHDELANIRALLPNVHVGLADLGGEC